MKCPKCKTEFTGKFCSNCGVEISRDEVEAKNDFNAKPPLLLKRTDSVSMPETGKREVIAGAMNRQKLKQWRFQAICAMISLVIVAGFGLFLWGVYGKADQPVHQVGTKVQEQVEYFNGITFKVPAGWEKSEEDSKISYKTENGGKLQFFIDPDFLVEDSFARSSVLEGLKVSDGVKSLSFNGMKSVKVNHKTAYRYDANGVLLSDKIELSIVMFGMPNEAGTMFCLMTMPAGKDNDNEKIFNRIISSIVIDRGYTPEVQVPGDSASSQKEKPNMPAADQIKVPEGTQLKTGALYNTISAVSDNVDIYTIEAEKQEKPKLSLVCRVNGKAKAEAEGESFVSFTEQVVQKYKDGIFNTYSGIWCSLRSSDGLIAVYHFTIDEESKELFMADSGIYYNSYKKVIETHYKKSELLQEVKS